MGISQWALKSIADNVISLNPGSAVHFSTDNISLIDRVDIYCTVYRLKLPFRPIFRFKNDSCTIYREK